MVKVDFIVRKDTDYRRAEFTRRRPASVEGRGFFIVAPEDLIISKLDWARESRSEVQLGDVRNLLAAVRDLDAAYLIGGPSGWDSVTCIERWLDEGHAARGRSRSTGRCSSPAPARSA